jgi:radical SAM protein with 4Fe4S-binding SPASM domain
LTYRCNLACRTCGAWRIGRAQGHRELDLVDVLRVVDETAALGVRSVYLVGSEVVLFEGWLDVLRRVRSHGMECALLTNALLFDRDLAVELMSANPTEVTVSIDGDETTHDKLRGKKSYRRAVTGLTELIGARDRHSPGTTIGVHMTISRANVGLVRSVADFAHEQGLPFSVQPVSYASPELIADSTVDGEPAATERFRPAVGMGLTEDDLTALRATHEALAREGRFIPSLHVVTSMPPALLAKGLYPIGRCHTIRHELCVEPDGRVVTCANVDAFTIGNVQEQSLAEIWMSSRRRRLAKTLGTRRPPICATCVNFGTNLRLDALGHTALRYVALRTATIRARHAGLS